MSGHSKWSTIKRKKEVTDAARGKVFSKLSKAISVAIVQGGGPNPETNYPLKVAIDAAKTSNMPRANIDRLLSKAGEQKNLKEIVYEGFGPGAVGVLVETVTDNTNRTSQEIKTLLEKTGGNLGGPGTVSFNFEKKGLIKINKEGDFDSQMLKLIDLGVEDISEEGDQVEVYVEPNALTKTVELFKKEGIKILGSEIMQKPKTPNEITDAKLVGKLLSLLDKLEDLDDVQKVYANFDASDDLISTLA